MSQEDEVVTANVIGKSTQRQVSRTPQQQQQQQHHEAPPPTDGETARLTKWTAKQQELMEESGKMLHFLRTEVFELRKKNKALAEDNQKLLDTNAQAGESFEALNQHFQRINQFNSNLNNEMSTLKEDNQSLSKAQAEIKDELKMKQSTYVAEVQTRLRYQKTMAKILDIVQEKCRDSRLVESVLTICDDCENEILDEEEQHNTGQQQPTEWKHGVDESEGFKSSWFGWSSK